MQNNPYSVGDRVIYIHPEAGKGIRMPRGSLATVIGVKNVITVTICFDEVPSSEYETWDCDVEYLTPVLFMDVDAISLL